jgi:hypothetical protein
MHQPLRALERANEIRSTRKQFKAGLLKMGPQRAIATCVHEIREPSTTLWSMAAEDFLTAIPRVGTVRARALLHDAQVSSPRRPLSDLSLSTRSELMRSLDDLAVRRYGKEAVHG